MAAAYLSATWDAHASRVVECRYSQQGVALNDNSTRASVKRLQLSQRGLEFASGAREPPATEQRDQVVPWSDILGATELNTEPRDTQTHAREFAVYGCVPKPLALEWANSSSDTSGVWSAWGVRGLLDALFCIGRNHHATPEPSDGVRAAATLPAFDAADASGKESVHRRSDPTARVLVQWVLRYSGDDADAFVPRVVRAIRALADPRTVRSTSPHATGDHEPAELPRRVRSQCGRWFLLPLQGNGRC